MSGCNIRREGSDLYCVTHQTTWDAADGYDCPLEGQPPEKTVCFPERPTPEKKETKPVPGSVQERVEVNPDPQPLDPPATHRCPKCRSALNLNVTLIVEAPIDKYGEVNPVDVRLSHAQPIQGSSFMRCSGCGWEGTYAMTMVTHALQGRS